ncbi:mediator of RNA polymerase II transcription subunit 25 isoform X2 [Agrilus planipennis]|uniref:Mediator of RNA polymerase II transcription subunit 25 n=1 Tax=Agrilus planipennis TaxID=224129 RepID=A0A1W4WS77_AGRPL|nr:mediator of RNA polymerase II transcription subunit 25 isoform X2 [Agrilus planipennis]
MVVCPPDHNIQADIVFVVEGTAINGAYINDLKTNYIIPSLEYFSQGNLDETSYLTENANSVYGIVIYYAADCLPQVSSDTFGPFLTPSRVLNALDKLELIGGKGESHANVAEGLATALQCFEELQQKRDSSTSNVQKHCILVCNSPPYLLPVMESYAYVGKTAEQLAANLLERGINLSIISPRKIPSLYKLFEKAGGDLTTFQSKNYAKDPRHLVLLRGFSLKERPVSPVPQTGTVSTSGLPLPSTNMAIPSLPSPLPNTDSPITSQAANQNILASTMNTGVGVQGGVGQNPVYRPTNPQGINPLTNSNQSIVTANMVNVNLVNAVRGGMMNNPQFSNQPIQAPPGYHPGSGLAGPCRPPGRWPLMPHQTAQQRSQFIPNQNQQPTTSQSSALIAQLTQPPSSMPTANVNQFSQSLSMFLVASNAGMNSQPQQLRLNMMGNQPTQQNVQTSIAAQNVQNSGMVQTGGITSTPGMPQTQTNPPQVTPSSQVMPTQSQPTPQQSNPAMGTGRERHTIWQGLLEWLEKPKNSSETQKITRQVPCQVSASSKDGEPELKADSWPPKLITQLMPKQLIGNIGGGYLKNSKSVIFHPQNCDALESLTKMMTNGFAGCVHFTSVPNPASCDIKVLILLYTPEKRAYLGFIPNDQVGFVDRLRKVIQQQKTTHMIRQSGTANVGMGSGVGTPPQMPVSNPASTQQGLMMSQTNTMAMGGGQITQNVNMQGAGVQVSQSGNPTGMMGGPLQRGPFDGNLEQARQQNLEKINQLKQTLEAAQQQEQQYKSQLERISHMKMSHVQEALQLAQQQEMQYKMMDQQRMAGTSNQAANVQQQRMMRPIMNTNNPGLRHLLQQQPQYRQQIMGMQPGMGGNGPRPMGQGMPGTPGNAQQPFDDVGNLDFMV